MAVHLASRIETGSVRLTMKEHEEEEGKEEDGKEKEEEEKGFLIMIKCHLRVRIFLLLP